MDIQLELVSLQPFVQNESSLLAHALKKVMQKREELAL
jgi:hypothetical protein